MSESDQGVSAPPGETVSDSGPQPGSRNVRPVVSHGAAFTSGTPNRAGGLAGGLGTRPSQHRVPAAEAHRPPTSGGTDEAKQDEAVPAGRQDHPESHAPAHTSAPRHPGRRSRGATARDTTQRGRGGRTPPTTARLPESLKRRLKRNARRRNLDYSLVLLEAFELHHTQIDSLFADDDRERASLGLTESSGLFPPRPVQVRDTRGVGTAQVNFALTDVERQVIEGLLEKHPRVPDRNALIVRVLKAHLDVVEPEVPSDTRPEVPEHLAG
jgi:hypothetical protein